MLLRQLYEEPCEEELDNRCRIIVSKDMSCPTGEILDPRVKRTRGLLQDAMRALVHEKPFNEISIQDVTTRATVNRATFYAHYAGKEELLANILKSDFQTFVESRLQFPLEMNAENFARFVAVVLEFVGERFERCPESVRQMESVIATAMQEELHDLFRHWIECSTPPAYEGHSPEMAATILSWSVYGAAHRWARGRRKRSAEAVAQSIVALLMPRELSLR